MPESLGSAVVVMSPNELLQGMVVGTVAEYNFIVPAEVRWNVVEAVEEDTESLEQLGSESHL